jgi:uncharacterized protein with NAD-binding domain and iron-sulfur cluster
VTRTQTVAILGGGVAGMSAAHELAERGFAVTVYEQRTIAGGKARSMPAPGTGTGRRPDLPAEHGFRFFPGFYKHLPDTMRRIPVAGRANGVFDHLVPATRLEVARAPGHDVQLPAHFPATAGDLATLLAAATRAGNGVPPLEMLLFAQRLLVLLTSCDERRFAEYEHQSWWEFSGAAHGSEAYRTFLADGVTRSLVAARAREMSARTGGYILLQLLLDLLTPGRQADRLLDGPTNWVWIDPWLEHLRVLGVDYRTEALVRRINCRQGRITGVLVGEPGGDRTVTADHYVCALPVEVMARLHTGALARGEPRLARLASLRTRWMNGMMFYLATDVPIAHGHTIYMDSPWALTSISQRQFWRDVEFAGLGDGTVRGILSVDISDWFAPGLSGKAASECSSREEIRDEVWAQLKAHLNDGRRPLLEDSNLRGFYLDDDIVLPNNENTVTNLEPLLINTTGSWDRRPDAVTSIENLFLASDYVRTHTDLATMEGANEAARRAVNGILDAAGSDEPRCPIWPLHEPRVFAPSRAADRGLFALGLPHPGRALAGLA